MSSRNLGPTLLTTPDMFILLYFVDLLKILHEATKNTIVSVSSVISCNARPDVALWRSLLYIGETVIMVMEEDENKREFPMRVALWSPGVITTPRTIVQGWGNHFSRSITVQESLANGKVTNYHNL